VFYYLCIIDSSTFKGKDKVYGRYIVTSCTIYLRSSFIIK